MHPRKHRRRLLRATNPEWQTVQSSNVHSALYAPDTLDFYVRFLRPGPDDIYVYPGREYQEWADFLNAASKGGWIWSNPIDGSWPFEQLTTRAWRDLSREDVPDENKRAFMF